MTAPEPEQQHGLRRWASGWRFVLLVWLVSRAYFLAVGALGDGLIATAWHGNVFTFELPGALSYWATWDGAWYEHIATEGYTSTAATAFFPLYPLLISAGTFFGSGPAVWAVAISLVACLAALFFFYEIAEDAWGTDVARCSALALAFFPTSFYLNAVYTEALFLALTTGAVWAARVRSNFLVVMVLGYLATITRNAGVLIVIPVLGELLRRRRLRWEPLLALVVIPGGLASYMLFLWRATGDPVLFSSVQRQAWGRTLTDPLTTLGDAWSAASSAAPIAADPLGLFAGTHSNPALIASNTYNLAFLALAMILLVVAAWRLPPDLSLYSLAVLALPVLAPIGGFPLLSFPRFVLVAFPLFYVLGMALARSRILLGAWLFGSASFGTLLTLMFVTWRWVA